MIGPSNHSESREERRCATCNGAMLAATVANAKWVEEYRPRPDDSRIRWPAILAGMRKKKCCCKECGSASPHDQHGILCTLKSENPKSEVA